MPLLLESPFCVVFEGLNGRDGTTMSCVVEVKGDNAS